jgi:ATP-binding cassette subfamily B multidrug efflux pump
MQRPFSRPIDVTAPPADERPPPQGLLAFYRHFLGEHRALFAALFGVGLLLAVSDALVPVFVGRLVALVGADDRAAALREAALPLAAMAVAIVVLRPLLVLADLRLRHGTMVPAVTARIRWLSHQAVMRQGWTFFQDDFAGRIAGRVMGTAGALRESAEAAIRSVWYLAVYGSTTLALLAAADWRLAAPTAAWGAGFVLYLRHYVPRLRGVAAASAAAHSTLAGRIVDTYTNILTVRLFSSARHEDAWVGDAVRAHARAQRDHLARITGFMFTLALLNTALLGATAAIGLWLWVEGRIGAGAVAMALPLVWQIAGMAGWVSWEVTGIFENVATVQEGMRTIAAPPPKGDAPGAPPLRVGRGAIRFERIRFAYPGGRAVFDDFTLELRPGERVGLVGRSGAGKSTLVSLLLRLHELDGGRILVDGQDIATVTQESLRAAIGVVAQDTALLHRSVGDNVRYGRPDADAAALAAAVRRAQADAFIVGLRDADGREGYEATVGERGVKLSGGQRQRIAIARVLLKDAPILVLDEATSALDSEAEAAIQEQLDALMHDRTTLAIAHRLSTLARMDRVVVLEGGRVVEQGPHAELLARDGTYAALWRRQSGGFVGAEDGHPAFAPRWATGGGPRLHDPSGRW